MQPSESSLNSLGFLKVFRDLPLPLLLESVFLAANASSVLFITCQVLAHVLASDCTPVCDPESSDVLVELEALTFLAVLVPPDAIVLSNRINGVHSRTLLFSSPVLLHLALVLITLSFLPPRQYSDLVSQDWFL